MIMRKPIVIHPAGRRAFTTCEVALAVFLLAVAMTTTVHVLGWVAAERRGAERRQWALQEAANVMEHLSALSWEHTDAESARAVVLSEEIRRKLPGPELTIDVDDHGAGGAASEKRLAVRLRWRNRAGGWESPVRLTAWVTRPRSSR
jgi:hypothetical protein